MVAPQVNADLTELETVPARLKARVRQLEWGEEQVAEKRLMITPWLHADWEGTLDARRSKSRPDTANQTIGKSRYTGSPMNSRPFEWPTGIVLEPAASPAAPSAKARAEGGTGGKE